MSDQANQNKIETFQDLLSKKLNPRDELIEGLIARCDFVILSGPQKKFKSLASLNVAIRAAQGEPWLRFQIYSPMRVGIVQQEIPEEGLKDRLEKMLTGIKDKSFLDWIFHFPSCRGLKLDSHADVNKLREWLDNAGGVDLLIVDPLYLFHESKESDPQDMKKVCEALQNIARDYDCGVLLVHHHGKPSQVEREGGDLHRGSSVLRDATDANWTFTRVPQNKYQLEGPLSQYVLLSFEQRHGLSPEPILLRLDFETLWLSTVDTKAKGQIVVEVVVECLRQQGGEMSNQDLIVTLMNRLGVGDRACRDAIYQTEEEGKIARGQAEGRGNRRVWRLPEKG